jgi:diguanylate cyclase (GGDEF)-like protein
VASLATSGVVYDAGRLVLVAAICLYSAVLANAGPTVGILLSVAIGCAFLSARNDVRLRRAIDPDLASRLFPLVEAGLAALAGCIFLSLTLPAAGGLAVLVSNALGGGLLILTFLSAARGARDRNWRFAAFALAVIVTSAAANTADPVLRVAEALFALLLAAGCVALEKGLSEARSAWRQARHEAEHDHLTGLLNRRGLERAFARSIPAEHLAGGGARYCLLYIDLDSFKNVNDLHGHARGDLLLRQVGQRIGRCFRSGDAVGRLGGDEFVVLFTHEDGSEVAVRSEQLSQSLTVPFHLDPTTIVTVNASIGVAMSTDLAVCVEQLLRVADAALYEAKAAGKATWRVKLCDAGGRRAPFRQHPGL